jgi:hypothetical protein
MKQKSGQRQQPEVGMQLFSKIYCDTSNLAALKAKY